MWHLSSQWNTEGKNTGREGGFQEDRPTRKEGRRCLTRREGEEDGAVRVNWRPSWEQSARPCGNPQHDKAPDVPAESTEGQGRMF